MRLAAMLCLAFLAFPDSATVLGGGDQNQNQNENKQQGEKENPNDNGERNRLCIACEASIDFDCPICPVCGCPEPDWERAAPRPVAATRATCGRSTAGY